MGDVGNLFKKGDEKTVTYLPSLCKGEKGQKREAVGKSQRRARRGKKINRASWPTNIHPYNSSHGGLSVVVRCGRGRNPRKHLATKVDP